MGRIRRFSRKEEDDPSVNLTPLIDVVFCILIVFIVIAPMLELDVVELSQAKEPEGSMAASVTESGPITIHVHQNNTVWLNHELVPIESLTDLLKAEKNRNPGARPQLYHDKRAHFGTYQAIKNAAEAAGFDLMDVILKPA